MGQTIELYTHSVLVSPLASAHVLAGFSLAAAK
jgi:hypothetical protein